MRLKQYIIEAKSLNNQVQKAVDKLCKEYKVPLIPIRFSNKQLSKGLAYYTSMRYKGSKTIIPKSITIGEWEAVQDYPDEWLYTVGHELAHHILGQTDSSLRHTKKHETLSKTLENKLKRVIGIKPKSKKPKISDKDLFKGQDPVEWLKDYIKKLG